MPLIRFLSTLLHISESFKSTLGCSISKIKSNGATFSQSAYNSSIEFALGITNPLQLWHEKSAKFKSKISLFFKRTQTLFSKCESISENLIGINFSPNPSSKSRIISSGLIVLDLFIFVRTAGTKKYDFILFQFPSREFLFRSNIIRFRVLLRSKHQTNGPT